MGHRKQFTQCSPSASLRVRDHADVSMANFLLFQAAMPPSMLSTLANPIWASTLAAILDQYPLPQTQTIGRFLGSLWTGWGKSPSMMCIAPLI